MNRRDFFRSVAAGLAIPVAAVIGGKAIEMKSLSETKGEFIITSNALEGLHVQRPYQWVMVDGTTIAPLTQQEVDDAVHEALICAFKETHAAT